jgi:hypothetical protein
MRNSGLVTTTGFISIYRVCCCKPGFDSWSVIPETGSEEENTMDGGTHMSGPESKSGWIRIT